MMMVKEIIALFSETHTIAGLSPLRPGIAPGSIHVGFVVDKVALG
jgi:hypothetical protein